MPIDCHESDRFSGCGIDGIETAHSSDMDTLCRGVVTDVVGVAANLDRPTGRKRLRVDELKRPGVSVCHSDRAGFRHERDALRFVKTAQGSQVCVVCGIQHFDRVVAERRDEQPLPRRVESQMIDSAAHPGHRHDGNLPERRRTLSVRA